MDKSVLIAPLIFYTFILYVCKTNMIKNYEFKGSKGFTTVTKSTDVQPPKNRHCVNTVYTCK